MSIPHTIFADFNNTDAQGRVRLTCNGTLHDLQAKNIELSSGLTVTLDDNDELSVIGMVEFSEEEQYGLPE